MKTDHLNDQSIQRYIFDFDNCDNSILEHIDSCEICLQIADNYKLLSKDLKNLENPVLNDNLGDLILEKITNKIEQKKSKKDYNYISAIVFIAIGVIAMMISAFKVELINQVETNNMYLYLIISIGVFTTILLSVDSFRSFNLKMNEIN